MSTASFQIVYDGPALENSEMAARDLSSALMAMDVILEEADKTVNGGRTETRLVVKGSFKTGSFKIDFSSFQSVVQKVKELFVSDNVTAVLNAAGILTLIGGVIGLIKWLKNRRPTRFELVDGKVRVFVHEKYIDVEKRVIDLLRNHLLKEALAKAISEPLSKEGIDTFAIIEGEKTIRASVSKEESQYFAAEKYEKTELEDRRIETHLNVVSPSFQGGDKWRVNDGGANFYVSISDQNFIERVLRGEVVFSAATTLKVMLHQVQYTDEDGILRKESEIEKVIRVVHPHEQLDFPDFPPLQKTSTVALPAPKKKRRNK